MSWYGNRREGVRRKCWLEKKGENESKIRVNKKGKKMNDKNVKDYDDIENNKNNTYEKNDWNNKHKNKNKNKNDSFSVTQLILVHCPH